MLIRERNAANAANGKSMTEEKKRRLHRAYGILLSVLSGVAGLSFIIACILIYKNGEGAFSRESVGAALLSVLAPAILFLLGVIGGIALDVALPLPSQKRRGGVSPSTLRRSLIERLPNEQCTPALVSSLIKEKRSRLFAMLTPVLVSAVLLVPVVIYFADLSHFTVENLNGDVVSACLFLLPFLSVSLLLFIGAVFFRKASLDRDVSLLKTAIAKKEAPEKTADKAPLLSRSVLSVFTDKEAVITAAVRLSVLTVATVFIVLGILNGGMSDVFEKAIRICTECIGLG